MKNDPNDGPHLGKKEEREIAAHIFTTSSVMLGLCLTIISVVNGQRSVEHKDTFMDDLVAIDALIFLVACFLSYIALRVRNAERMHRVESLADGVFLLGMIGMGLACVLYVWTVL